jgi:nitroimidazol reductase NimA-like FMN-containing flavoprotein (pyridoxamine 5'-phosphate oxidase superfamily)
MDREECLQLLGDDVVGRLAIVYAGSPEIFPVNYVLDDDNIVFRTDPGTKLNAERQAQACFEIDEIDRDSRTGWSVAVFGRLEEVTMYHGRTWARVQQLAIEPWAGGAKGHWMRLVATRISGRRIS